MEHLLVALHLVFTWKIFLVIICSCFFGLFCGAMPGISATVAVALMVPVTFYLPPEAALASMATAVALAIFAGDIPGALLRIPGVPSSAAYADEAYAMTKKGLGEKALGISLVCSVIGGLVGALGLSFSAPLLAEFALLFQYYEYFWLACMGLTTAAFICGDNPAKGLLSTCLGLLLSTVGYSILSGAPRFTFEIPGLMEGIHFISALIGVFAVGEVCRQLTRPSEGVLMETAGGSHVFQGTGRIVWKYKWHLQRGALLGVVIGALPGAGSDIAAWVSYGVAKKFSKEPDKFGTGHPEGIVAAAASNNSSTCATWIPSLVFGIPGDSVTAIVIGVLYLKGLQPGPVVFLENAPLVYSIFVSFFIANLVLLPMGFMAIKVSKQMLRVQAGILMPLVLVFCTVGCFAINNSLVGVVVMLVLGFLSFFMQENGFPVAPVILGMVMGPLLEENFMQAMIVSQGNILDFFRRPIAAALGTVTILVWMSPLLRYGIGRIRAGYRNPGGSREAKSSPSKCVP
jgi:putative tricarboxylic transport membrane protein